MDAETLHTLTAAYALDALDPDERGAYEEHLATCERCREELGRLSVVTAELAFAADPVSPPPALRERILDAARSERPNVVPLRPRRRAAVAAVAVAAVAVCAAVGLGIWNISLHDQLSNTRQQTLQRIPMTGVPGSLVVSPSGRAALVVYRIGAAPAGKTYEAWIVQGAKATPAGLFRGGGATFLPIAHAVPKGAVVAVTVEPAGGSPAPTTKPFAVSAPV
jgi:anti-sigma-K factor RskA